MVETHSKTHSFQKWTEKVLKMFSSIWHKRVHHGPVLACKIWSRVCRLVVTGALIVENWANIAVFGGFSGFPPFSPPAPSLFPPLFSYHFSCLLLLHFSAFFHPPLSTLTSIPHPFCFPSSLFFPFLPSPLSSIPISFMFPSLPFPIPSLPHPSFPYLLSIGGVRMLPVLRRL